MCSGPPWVDCCFVGGRWWASLGTWAHCRGQWALGVLLTTAALEEAVGSFMQYANFTNPTPHHTTLHHRITQHITHHTTPPCPALPYPTLPHPTLPHLTTPATPPYTHPTSCFRAVTNPPYLLGTHLGVHKPTLTSSRPRRVPETETAWSGDPNVEHPKPQPGHHTADEERTPLKAEHPKSRRPPQRPRLPSSLSLEEGVVPALLDVPHAQTPQTPPPLVVEYKPWTAPATHRESTTDHQPQRQHCTLTSSLQRAPTKLR